MERKRPGGQMKPAQGSPELTKSALNPLPAKAGELLKREYFWPILVTTLVVVLIWYFLRHRDIGIVYHGYKVPMHSVLLTGYLSFACFFLILKFVGKRPNWLMLGGVGALVCLDMFYQGPLLTLCMKFFRDALLPLLNLPPELPKGNRSFPLAYAYYLVSAGLMEEVYKALPTLALLWVGLSKLSPWNQRIGVREPLDGILCGAMAGASFTLIETGFNYVPADPVAQIVAFQNLAPRTLGEFAGHVGYAGYAGYFIGLAALHPARKWRLIAIGIGSAAAVHALWNSASTLGEWGKLLPAALAIFMLGSAILKAREISPNRSQLAASRIISGMSSIRVPNFIAPALAVNHGGNPSIAAQIDPPRSETWGDGAAALTIALGTARVPVAIGARLYERQAPGTSAQRGDGIVAEVNVNPNDPKVFGLKNLSNQTWDVTTDQGEHRTLAPGRSIRLAQGTRIQIGDLMAELT